MRGEPRIAIWSTSIPVAGYLTYDAETFDDILTASATFREWPDPPVQVNDLPLDKRLTLVQIVGVEPATVAANDVLYLLTIWRPEEVLDRDYKLFVHIADAEGRPLAQWDGLPGMNTQRTSQWPVGELSATTRWSVCRMTCPRAATRSLSVCTTVRPASVSAGRRCWSR